MDGSPRSSDDDDLAEAFGAGWKAARNSSDSLLNAADGYLTLVRHRGPGMVDDGWKREVDFLIGKIRTHLKGK